MMWLALLIPVVVLIVLFAIIRFSKGKKISETRWNQLFRVCIVCLGLSALALLTSVYNSGKMENLLKLSSPITVMIILLAVRNQRNKRKNLETLS